MGGMIRAQTVYSGLKLFVSALAAVLLFKLFNGSPDLFSTFFVFMTDKAIDTFFSTNTYESNTCWVWGIVNGIAGSIACISALVVTFWTDDGSVISYQVLILLRYFFGICIVSFLIRDAALIIWRPFKTRNMIQKFNDDDSIKK